MTSMLSLSLGRGALSWHGAEQLWGMGDTGKMKLCFLPSSHVYSQIFCSSRVLRSLYWTLRLYKWTLPCGWLLKLMFLLGDRAANFFPTILLTSFPQTPHKVSNVKLTQSLLEAPSRAEKSGFHRSSESTVQTGG